MYKVIIVEDELLIRRGLIQTIPWSEHGCEVVGEASDGQEGMELALQANPDIVITDIHMPGEDGLTMIEKLKGRIDTLSISLNAINAPDYVALCHPIQGEAAYQAMLDFAKEAKEYVPHVVMTIVDKDKTAEEIETCRKITENLGVKLRVRSFIDS